MLVWSQHLRHGVLLIVAFIGEWVGRQGFSGIQKDRKERQDGGWHEEGGDP